MFAAGPAVLFFLRQAHLCEDAASELGDDVVDGLGRVVEGGHGGHDGGAGVVDAEHVFKVNAVEGSFAQAEHKGAALFQANVSGAGKQVVGDTGGDGGEGAGGAGDYDHGVNGGAAGGDGGADVLVGQVLDFFCGHAGEERGEFFRAGRDHVEFGGDQPQAGIGSDQENSFYARVGVEQAQNGLRVHGAACSGDADRDASASGFRHGNSRIMESRWAVSAKSRREQRISRALVAGSMRCCASGPGVNTLSHRYIL